jgi:hypothetical protein
MQMDDELEPEILARVIRDEPRNVFIATVLATGETYEAADSDEIAAWLSIYGVEPGHVSMPREQIESVGDRMNINYMLRAIYDAEIRSRAEARSAWPRSEKSARLEKFIKSPEFLERANAAVEKAIGKLEAKGIKPAYIMRERKGD